jgi:hypothetical protein
MGMSAAEAAWILTYQLSPIIFTGGIANNIPGGALPIILLTEGLSFLDGVLSGGADLSLDDYFAHFVALPGSKLIVNEYAKVPFANQAVAANARIKQPNTLSMRMICPAKGDVGYNEKLAIISALGQAVEQHSALGGTYTVATPAQYYPNMLCTEITDTSAAGSTQPQNTYQWDFWQPLLTLQDAQNAQNSLMGQISAGVPVGANPSLTGLGPTTGNPASLGSIGSIPSASGAGGTQVASPTLGINS